MNTFLNKTAFPISQKCFLIAQIHILSIDNIIFGIEKKREGSGSVVVCLTRDRGVVGSSLTASLGCVLQQDTFILA